MFRHTIWFIRSPYLRQVTVEKTLFSRKPLIEKVGPPLEKIAEIPRYIYMHN
jgi:hypothetical protein